MWGANDPFADVALGERVAKACRASFRVVDGGHLPWIDQPVACAAAVPIDGDANPAVSSSW